MKDTLAQFSNLFGPACSDQHAVQGEADELQRLVGRIMLQRADLTCGYVLEQISKLGTETVYSSKHWAQVCLDLANLGFPLPWERGYHERQYLALLAKYND